MAPQRRTLSPAAIDRQRQFHVATIARARALGENRNALLDKATSLLTTHWGMSTWDGRAAILKTVDWLLQVALNNPAPNPGARSTTLAALRRHH
jgi:hypothetical protein